MTAWLVVAIVVIWFVLSASLLVSLCMMSSRFHQSEQKPPEEQPGVKGTPREGWLAREG